VRVPPTFEGQIFFRGGAGEGECPIIVVHFNFQLPTVLLEKRREKFVNVYGAI